jgi:hypothetical protein
MQARLESSTAGRIAISVFVVVLLVGIVTANVPPSALQHRLLRLDHPLVYALGLDQNWNVFAPDPRRQVFDLQATVRYADGSLETWQPPSGGALVGAYWDYRWRKWLENVTQDQNAVIWKPAALYVAWTRREQHPVSVTLVRSWYDLPPPGHVRDAPNWKSYDFYIMPVYATQLRQWGVP